MATFSRSTFDAASYLAFRPSYPAWTYRKVLAYHFGRVPSAASASPILAHSGAVGAKPTLAVDLGCGPGISTLAFLPHFDKVIGIDPSQRMVEAAVRPGDSSIPEGLRPDASEGEQGKLGELEYRQGTAEDLDAFDAESIDLIAAGQAAHWFDFDRLWPALARVLKPGGSVCFWGYPDMFFPDYPSTRQMVMDWSVADGVSPDVQQQMSKDDDAIGPYWEQPGRGILSNCYGGVAFPSSAEWDVSTAVRRIYSTEGLLHSQLWNTWPSLPSPQRAQGDTAALPAEVRQVIEEPGILDKKMTWHLMDKYLHTWSAVHTYQEKHPGDRERREGDVVARFLARIREEVARVEGGLDKVPEEVTLRWPMGFVMIKKKA